MNFNDFPYFSDQLITLTSDEDLTTLNSNSVITLQRYNDEFLLVQGHIKVLVNCSSKELGLVTAMVDSIHTLWMLSHISNKQIHLLHVDPRGIKTSDLQLGTDQLITDDLYNKNEIPENSMEMACQWLNDTFILNIIQSNGEEKEYLTIARFSNSKVDSGFQLLGKGWRADIVKDKDQRFLVRRITQHRQKEIPFSLLTGHFLFTDESVAAQLTSAVHQAELKAAIGDGAGYLELWNLYNEKEWENALAKASTLKVLKFISCEPFEDGQKNRWAIYPADLEGYLEFKQRWNDLELDKNTQVDLSVTPPDWLEELNESETENTQESNPRGKLRFEKDHIIFTPSSNRKETSPNFTDNNGEGCLFLSLAGQRVIGKRRLAAKQLIDSGKHLRQLNSLLEGVAIASERRRTIPGLTPYAKETFKGGTPTDNQELALEAALNTPDLAIIIGPPGTGKTQVIAALQRRIAEEAKDQNISGQVLVSSFQHDAVDNALDRSNVFNLPGIRVGGKKLGADEENHFSSWIDNQAKHLTTQADIQHQKFPELKLVKSLNDSLTLLRVSQYSPIQLMTEWSNILDQLREVKENRIRISARLENDFEEYLHELSQTIPALETSANNVGLIRRIRALRICTVSFSDDGPDRATDLLRWLEHNQSSVTEETSDLLKNIAKETLPTQQQLRNIEFLRNRLLDQHLSDCRLPELKNKLDTKAFKLISQLESSLESSIQQHKQGVASVLEELANSIVMDRKAALDTVEEYAMVIGATCQQAAGNKMASLKSVADLESTEISFETVIVDEAARANPLDLFIPMSMATRRIILVGDDKQLPHMLEPAIEDELLEEHQLTELHLEAFRLSLFERLRLQLENLPYAPSKPRIIMLDTQFRMHPVLGDFISKQFYENTGMAKVKSGRPESDFAFHNDFLTELGSNREVYENKVCRWIDIPQDEGKTIKRGTSWVRESESDRIAEEVKRLLIAAGNSLSIGIITFYAAQRDLIMNKLAATYIDDIPIMIKTENGFEPHELFKWALKEKNDGTLEKEEGLRVGSVDAFQGKEFDIVFLSSVRTWNSSNSKFNRNSNKIHDSAESKELNEKQMNRQFGFLRLPNRMNVAMSRQRQMLICVGDSGLVTNELSEQGIPAFHAFYKLCGGQHGSLS
ncbi:conserved hypothetical protein [Oleispira antarctica RB-8]|uniref:AAA+ ATPase domain-containing protein n=1 Tax=Oleispira antarctica RB-8 TaxID=698738 RepID=R4YT34_OLEAN|nr:conserved hypothetical protein [Oleispira antarctica RB-8]